VNVIAHEAEGENSQAEANPSTTQKIEEMLKGLNYIE